MGALVSTARTGRARGAHESKSFTEINSDGIVEAISRRIGAVAQNVLRAARSDVRDVTVSFGDSVSPQRVDSLKEGREAREVSVTTP